MPSHPQSRSGEHHPEIPFLPRFTQRTPQCGSSHRAASYAIQPTLTPRELPLHAARATPARPPLARHTGDKLIPCREVRPSSRLLSLSANLPKTNLAQEQFGFRRGYSANRNLEQLRARRLAHPYF
jgi:hypothetical protein